MRYLRTRADALAYREKLRARGAALAPRVQWLRGTEWSVPSASGGAPHLVDLARETCDCPSWARLNGADRPDLPRPEPPVRCKHIWAAVLAANLKRSAS